MKITFLGHATLQIELESAKILVDPFITGNEMTAGKVDVNTLDPDYILLTHAHQDHTLDVEVVAKNSDATIVSNFEILVQIQNVHSQRFRGREKRKIARGINSFQTILEVLVNFCLCFAIFLEFFQWGYQVLFPLLCLFKAISIKFIKP